MKLRKALLPVLAGSACATISSAAAAQHHGTAAQHADNARMATDLRAMIAKTGTRVDAAQARGTIKRMRAAVLRRQLAQTRQSLVRVSSQQGFVSAAENGTYHRTLGKEVDRAGAPRSYGDDALPSDETLAFRRVDDRLHYRDARIEWDGNSCAIYEAIGPDGRTRREPLLSKAGKALCVRR